MNQKKLLLLISTVLVSTFNYGQVVSTVNDLETALENATAGTTITIANGTWKDVFIEIDEKDGSLSAPITIQAETPGAVLMTGNSRVYMKGSYITVSGLVFQDPENLSTNGDKIAPVFDLDECDYCKVISNKIDTYNGTESEKELTFKWILADGQFNEIAYNSFLGKYGIGSIINDNRDSSEPDYLTIHHNYFADRTPINEVNEDNDQDAIRIGNSGTSLDNSFTEVYDNYFHNFFGEVEMISNKSGENKYYNNTFRNYAGSLTLRHGDNCEVYGNYFFAEKNTFSAGVRVIGENHKIYNNYIEGVNSTKSDGSVSNATGGINVSNGRQNTELNGYYRVQNTSVVNNTFVDCDFGLRIGTKVKSDLEQEPINLIVANNIMYNTENPYQIVTEPSGGNSFSEGNITNLSDGDLSDDGDFHRLTAGSPAIDAGLGNFSFLTQDILEGTRSSNFDAGAEEYNAGGVHLPFTISDVGTTIGFGAIIPNAGALLNAIPSNLNFSVDGTALIFDITSNVEWSITTNANWLTLGTTSGSDSASIIGTASENTTGTERTTVITITENLGGDDLETTVSVTQSDGTFNPNIDSVELTVVSATAVGTEPNKDNVNTNFAWDGVVTNSEYWTGDAALGETSITFDLMCDHELTELGIHLLKADERTVNFDVAIASDGSDTFTTILSGEESSIDSNGVDAELFFSLNRNTARYVKFTGNSNSGSGAAQFISVAEFNIYGNAICSSANPVLSTESFDSLDNKGVTLFPVPVTDGELTIDSSTFAINKFQVYNMAGEQVISGEVDNQNLTQLDTSNLASGVYFIVLDEIGVAKFIVE